MVLVLNLILQKSYQHGQLLYSISELEVLSLTVWPWRHRKAVGGKGLLNQSMNQLINYKNVFEQPLALLGSAKH